MDSVAENFGWIELVVFAVVALGFGFYQIWSVNREIARDKAKAEAKKAEDDGNEAV